MVEPINDAEIDLIVSEILGINSDGIKETETDLDKILNEII